MSTKVWQKIAEVIKVRDNARYKPSPYLEVRRGARKTSFRVNFRAEGVEIRKTLKGRFQTIEDWEPASRQAEKLIAAARFGEKDLPKDMVRSEDICRQLLDEGKDQDEKTVQGKEYIYGKYMIPWLNEFLPYAADLSVTTWPRYKAWLRASNPTRALENHAKYFRTFQNRVFELGVVKQKVRLDFDAKKEDFRKPGLIIPNEVFDTMLKAAAMQANRAWYIRLLLGRFTGMRPSEARCLRKKSVAHPRDPSATLPPNVEFLNRGGTEVIIIRIFPEDNKENRYREFIVSAPEIVGALKSQSELERIGASPYFFPLAGNLNRPMDKSLGSKKKPETNPGSWYWLLSKAGGGEYTPHDLRHTYATEMFKATNDWAQLCYQLDMTLETARKVYLHLEAKDTATIAEVAALRFSRKESA